MTELKSRTAILNWQTPFAGNLPLLQITMQLTEHLSGRPPIQRNATLPNTVHQSCPLADLKPLRNYSLRLTARNQLGESDPSLWLHFQTEEEGSLKKAKKQSSKKRFFLHWD